jgi:hypothetical protein
MRKALEQAGRTDLIGGGCDALIPVQPPREALRARREQANKDVRGEYVHTVPNPRREERGTPDAVAKPSRGYRPQRRTARRRDRK